MEAVACDRAWMLLERWAGHGQIWMAEQRAGGELLFTMACHGKRGSLIRGGSADSGEPEHARLILDGCSFSLFPGDAYSAVYDGEAGSIATVHGDQVLTFHARER